MSKEEKREILKQNKAYKEQLSVISLIIKWVILATTVASIIHMPLLPALLLSFVAMPIFLLGLAFAYVLVKFDSHIIKKEDGGAE